MQAVILAAGRGVRMQPLTYEIPKPMLRVQGKPILAYTIDLLPAEIDEIIIVVGYLGDQIKEYFGQDYNGRKVVYVEQQELLGTGHALSLCRDILHDRFLVLMGDDIYSAADIPRCLEYEQSILAKEVTAEEKRNYGAFEINDKGDLIGITEKELPTGDKFLVNTGLYVLDMTFFDYDLVSIKDGKEFGLPQTLVNVAKDHPIRIVKTDYWLPIGYPDDIEKAEIYLRKNGVIR
ncbi:MAG: sugar phosphate nucleotidyltransferase [Patescibacteria group bacterium]|jgi:bifunctional UDP-N-acetylglucosamine pyrophosphorylase/glucosamine-1-phosphate N-acetyltransferase